MVGEIAWLGQQYREEFRTAWDELSQSAEIRQYASISALRNEQPPGLVVVAISRPGEYSLQRIVELQKEWADTRFLCVLGAWCCGQKRTAVELKELAHVYAFELQTDRVLQQLLDCERAACDKSASARLLAIYARSQSYRSGLAESLSPHFQRLVELDWDASGIRGVDVVVWEANPNRDRRQVEIETLASRHEGARVVALVTYPREFEREFYKERGVSVVALPFQVSELLAAIRTGPLGTQSQTKMAV